MTSDRIEELEIALAHAEAAIQDLSEMVTRQGAEIAALQREAAKLTRSLEAMMEGDEDAPPVDQPPPHW